MSVIRALTMGALFAGALACAPTSAADLPAPATPVDADAIDQVIQQRMDEAGLVGVGAAIIVDRKLVWSKGYGFADKARAVRFTPDTVMNIGSISKTVTGVALMQAVQAGKLSLDADINTYLPFKVVNPFHPDIPITLRHLATHTSGIADRPAVYRDAYHWGGDAPEALGDFLRGYFVAGGRDYAQDNFLAAKPGTHREYSNIAAGLAGYIVERATGERLDAYTRKRIFAPLKMEHSGWFLSDPRAAAHSKLYIVQDGVVVPIPLYGVTTYPDGGVRTSVADLSRLFIALLGDGQYEGARILSPASVAEMRRFQYTPANKPGNVDLAEKNSGIFWSTKFNVSRVGHGGVDPGVRTEMLADLSGRVGVVLFANTSVSGSDAKVYASLLDELWRHAAAFEAPPRMIRAPR